MYPLPATAYHLSAEDLRQSDMGKGVGGTKVTLGKVKAQEEARSCRQEAGEPDSIRLQFNSCVT